MDFVKIVKAVRPVLSVLTDLLMIGRGKGWWNERPTIPGGSNGGGLNLPHR